MHNFLLASIKAPLHVKHEIPSAQVLQGSRHASHVLCTISLIVCAIL